MQDAGGALLVGERQLRLPCLPEGHEEIRSGLLSFAIARLVGNCGLSHGVPHLWVGWCPVLLVRLSIVADGTPVCSNRCRLTGR